MNREHLSGWLKDLQKDICLQLEYVEDKAKFTSDAWTRKEGGGGISMVLSGGAVFEKAGVMFSAVEGAAPPFLFREQAHSTAGAAPVNDPRFFATGVSIVIHPANPHVPIIHMNIRYFELCTGKGDLVSPWFGGGIDLTPHYVDPTEATAFHKALRDVCNKHDAGYYPRFKDWADQYFFLPHRNETRGIGGIFFDKLGSEEKDMEKALAFWKDVGSLFAPLYTGIVEKKKNKLFTERERHWQLLRRGRYVEFNLLYDKGTRFGLESGGRIESILVSMPATAGWEYNFVPGKGSEEEKTLGWLKKGIDWCEWPRIEPHDAKTTQ